MNIGKTDEIAALIRERQLHTVIVAGAETNGFMKGKFLPAHVFLDLVNHQESTKLSNVFFVANPLEEQLIEPPAQHRGYFPSRQNGFPDLLLKPDVNTFRVVPWLDKTGLVIGDFTLEDGSPIPVSPRHVLKRVIQAARNMGYEPFLSFEYEFYLVPESAESLKEKHYTNIKALTPRSYTYDIYRGVLDEDVIAPLRQQLQDFGIQIEASNTETGPGQFELNLRYGPALEAADQAFLYKCGIKQYAAKKGYIATFMAKPQSDWAGNSCHVHVSLWKDGQNQFWREEPPHLTDTLRHFSAGLLQTMGPFSSLFAPTVNSYKRLIPYSWAATTASWGLDNRSTGLRLVLEGPNKTRLEHRMGGGDSNPYLVAAAIIAGGLFGIAGKLEPPALYGGDAYVDPSCERLPRSLEEALKGMAGNEVANEYFGEDFVNYYTVVKQDEVEAARLAVTDWEVRRYFEMF